MDANGTRFHLYLGAADWARCTDDSDELAVDLGGSGPPEPVAGFQFNDTTKDIALLPLLFHFIAGPSDHAPAIDDRRGAAADRTGNWYWIDDDRKTLKVKSSGSGEISDFWPLPATEAPAVPPGSFGPIAAPPPQAAATLGGLAVTAHHRLLVGTVEPPGFLVFDLAAGGPPDILHWPAGVPFVPFDIAAAPDGGARVLDRMSRRIWILDAQLRVVAQGQSQALLEAGRRDDFQPLGGGPDRLHAALTFPLGIALALAVPVPALDPIAIEVTSQGDVLVLDRAGGDGGGRILRFRLDVELGAPAALHIGSSLADGGGASGSPAIVPHDFAYLPAAVDAPARVYVATAEGNQAFAFDLGDSPGGDLTLTPILEYLPMRLFQGKALAVLDGAVYHDHPGGFIQIVEQQRPRFVQSAILTTDPLDGRVPGCVWHRLLIDGRIPGGAGLLVQTRAADDAGDLDDLPWMSEPPLYKRTAGPELPYLPRAAIGDLDTFELLFQRARGRHLQIRIIFEGNGRVTPRIRALRAWYPRFSYLSHYLPATYREDPDSASFLDRFLANPEGTLTAIEDRIAAAQVLLDVRSAPAEALEWLASFFGMALDPAWDEDRRRLFIRHAMDFFQYRGTVRGIGMALRLALDECPDDKIFTDPDDAQRATVRIVERFRARSAPGVLSGDVTDAVGIRVSPPEKRWKPADGADALDRRWRDALAAAGAAGPAGYPLRLPDDPTLASLWTALSREALGFVPSSTDADTGAWQAFLADRYRTISALGAAHGATAASFVEIALPASLPRARAPLLDWYQFEQIVIPMRQTAHRFRVLVPVPTGSSVGDAERVERLQRAARIVDLERPAHTTYDVRFYFAMFRVGEARLGIDTLVDLGGRAPGLMAPVVLGARHLAEGFLARPWPPGARRRGHVSDWTVSKERLQ